MAEPQQPAPGQKERVGVYLEQDLAEKLQLLSVEKGTSVSAIVCELGRDARELLAGVVHVKSAPFTKKKRQGLYLESDVAEQLQALAKERKSNLSGVVSDLARIAPAPKFKRI